MHPTLLRSNISPTSGKKFIYRKNNSSSAISRSIKVFPEFLENINNDQDILSAVKGYKITFSTKLHQKKIPGNIHMSIVQENLVVTVISQMLTKGAISLIQKDQIKGFLNNLFLVGKRDRGYGSVINLKKLTNIFLTSTSK